MIKQIKRLGKLQKKLKGQSLAEYGLILALIAIVAIAGLTQLGAQVNTQLGGVAQTIGTSAPGQAGAP